MEITYDPAKRAITLAERGLDFADAEQVFTGVFTTRRDRRFNYGEARFNTAGFLGGRFVMVAWTPRGNARHIISMRYGHAKERRRWQI